MEISLKERMTKSWEGFGAFFVKFYSAGIMRALYEEQLSKVLPENRKRERVREKENAKIQLNFNEIF